MSKIKKPILFSEHFNIDARILYEQGIFNPVLNADTQLFIDPLLLSESMHPEIGTNAATRHRKFFEDLILLLNSSNTKTDPAWKAARRMLSMHEVKGTCLGYGSQTIAGSALGPKLTETVLKTSKEIVDMGCKEPEIFALVALLEDGVGADRISDMSTNIILPDLCDFSARFYAQHLPEIPTEKFLLRETQYLLTRNPFFSNTPIILVPTDVLRTLPVALSWDDLQGVYNFNQALRDRVNIHVGEVWRNKLKEACSGKAKDEFRELVLEDTSNAQDMVDIFKCVPKVPYDLRTDSEGVWTWLPKGHEAAKKYPLKIEISKERTAADLEIVVRAIVGHFKKLVEDKGLWKEFWNEAEPRPEKSAQRLFFAVADVYCEANNLDITPEADSGNGPVDFKFSSGYEGRHLVEIKLSTNNKIVHGYDKQLEIYKSAESCEFATYLVIELGAWEKKRNALFAAMKKAQDENRSSSNIVVVDAQPKNSASKRQ